MPRRQLQLFQQALLSKKSADKKIVEPFCVFVPFYSSREEDGMDVNVSCFDVFKKSCSKIWWNRKKFVPLHSLFEKEITFKANMVDVVQLVRASDCGSECRGFESHLPPKINPARFISCRVSCFITLPLSFRKSISASSLFLSFHHRNLHVGVNLTKSTFHQRISETRTVCVRVPAHEGYQEIPALESTRKGRRQKPMPFQLPPYDIHHR